jgi:hypothetical protein
MPDCLGEFRQMFDLSEGISRFCDILSEGISRFCDILNIDDPLVEIGSRSVFANSGVGVR